MVFAVDVCRTGYSGMQTMKSCIAAKSIIPPIYSLPFVAASKLYVYV